MKDSSDDKVQKIEDHGVLIALVLRNSFNRPGVTFLTPDNLSQQLAFQKRPAGDTVKAHFHNPVPRSVEYTFEVLIIKRGRLRVDLYRDNKEYLQSVVLNDGDTILLVAGGHALEVLDDVELVEVKQGPYLGLGDKSAFEGVTSDKIRIINQ